ncbi:hypothetical protein [Aeromonas hydrophila]|uniref:hypothetical protein n=1 Tax=Aeromonas hydrophila TaxID=644 RepID=UPI00114D2B68|nr:hypothetical protein [Aeromonas hydrophila]
MDTKDIPLGGLDKAMSARWALVFLASIAFVDSYLILSYDTNISSVDFTWIKAHLDFSDALNFIALFTVTFGLLIPGLAFVGKIMLGVVIDMLINKFRNRSLSIHEWHRSKDNIDHINYIEKNALREWAIKTSNSPAYKDYENFEANVKEMAFISFMCQSFIFLSLFGWLMSGDSNPILLEVITSKIEAQIWYIKWPLKLIFFGFCLFYVGMAFRDDEVYRDYIPLKGHGMSDQNKNDIYYYKRNIKGG